MEEQKLKELIEKAINKGWVFYGEFSTDVATESVLKLLKEQLHIPIVVRQSEQLSKRPNTSSTWECFTKEEKQQKGNV